jgi:hypothetical protein
MLWFEFVPYKYSYRKDAFSETVFIGILRNRNPAVFTYTLIGKFTSRRARENENELTSEVGIDYKYYRKSG